MKKTIITIAIAALISGTALPLHADSFNEILDEVTANNPALKSRTATSQASLDEMRAEGNLPDPEVEFSHRWGPAGVGNKWDISVSQSFDWPGVYAARSKAVKSTSAAMDYLVQSDIIDTRMETRLLLLDIVNTRQNIAALESIYDGIAQLSDLYRKAVLQGEVTRLDYNKIEIERIAIEGELDNARATLDVLNSSLTALNGGIPVSTPVESYPEPDLAVMAMTPADIADYITSHDPAIAANRLSGEAAGALATAARRSRLPGFSVGYVHENEMGENFNGFSVGVSLPFFSSRHKAKAAEWSATSLRYDNDMLVSQRVAQFTSARARALAAKKTADAYRPVVETDDNLTLLRKALDGGQISMLTFIQEENYFRQARRSYLDALYNYHLALAELMRYE